MEDHMKSVDLTEVVAWEGAVSLEQGDGWIKPWRIPHKQRQLFPPVDLVERASTPAGVRLSFQTNASCIALKVAPMAMPANIDLVCNGELAETVSFEQGQTDIRFTSVPEGDKWVEIYLPQAVETRVCGLFVDEAASVDSAVDTRPRWITYGSSITHCGGAASPAQTWPALVARSRGLHLTCLGYGGNCHAEPMLARMIRDLPADFISLKIGINIYGGASLGPRTFRAAVIGFVKIVREGHPNVPIALCSAIYSPPREDTKNAVGFTLKEMRAEVEAAAEALVADGDKNLYYFNGLDFFGPEDVQYLPDELHPDAEGYRLLAKKFESTVFSKIAL